TSTILLLGGALAADVVFIVLPLGFWLLTRGGEKPNDGGTKGQIVQGEPGKPVGQVAPEKPAPPVARTIDLLKLIDPGKDAISGAWERKGNDLVGQEPAGPAVLEVPYHVPEEYDF